MTAVTEDELENLRALAHESRLMIVDQLSRGECSVGDLTDLIGSDVSIISKHLALLRAHGIVENRREGNSVYYRLLTPCVCNVFTCAVEVLKERRGGNDRAEAIERGHLKDPGGESFTPESQFRKFKQRAERRLSPRPGGSARRAVDSERGKSLEKHLFRL